MAGLDKGSPLLVLDGNHRLDALWWAATENNQINLDLNIWIGFSPDIPKYKYYERILRLWLVSLVQTKKMVLLNVITTVLILNWTQNLTHISLMTLFSAQIDYISALI